MQKVVSYRETSRKNLHLIVAQITTIWLWKNPMLLLRADQYVRWVEANTRLPKQTQDLRLLLLEVKRRNLLCCYGGIRK